MLWSGVTHVKSKYEASCKFSVCFTDISYVILRCMINILNIFDGLCVGMGVGVCVCVCVCARVCKNVCMCMHSEDVMHCKSLF